MSGLVSEVGCKVGNQVTGMLPHLRGPRGMLVMSPPQRYIVRKLYLEGGAIVARPSDPRRGWHRDAGTITIFIAERPPDIYVGAEFFRNFAVKGV